MLKRAIFGSIFIGIVLAGIFLGLPYFAVIMFVLMIASSYEFLRLFQVKTTYVYVFSLIVNASIFYVFCLFLRDLNNDKYLNVAKNFILLLPFASFIFELFQEDLEETIKDVSTLALCAIYIGLPFGLIMEIVQHNEVTAYDYYIPLGIFIIIWANDTFAYLVGKNIGKHKLFERLSPKKTIEGFIGGMVFSVIAGILFQHFLDPTHYWVVIALIVSVFGTLGDLIESMFKRRTGVKDSGSFIPGHGGFLDRLDSFIFCIPFVYIYLYII